jgi:hypothetical protein
MRVTGYQFIVIAMLFTTTARAQPRAPTFFTNQTAIANGDKVWSAVVSGDNQAKTNIQALVGSQVVFVGEAQRVGSANLVVGSNVVVEVELKPWRDVYRNEPHARVNYSEVSGTLKNVDFDKRVITIKAKPNEWKNTESE